MSTHHEFSQKDIDDFCNEHGVTIDLTVDQKNKFNAGKTSPILLEQLSSIADQMCPNDGMMKKFIEEKSAEFAPISLTLFVINEALWKIMTRRPEHPDKMLPMTTMPWFYWESSAEDKYNPLGVKMQEDPKKPLSIQIEENTFTINGSGGDFCGLLEGRFVDKGNQGRSIIIPGGLGVKKLVPNYESKEIHITVKKDLAKLSLYPDPIKKLDYNFSEHAKVFYDHGLQIAAEGEEVTLKAGNRKPTQLRGEVKIFIGKNFEKEEDSSKILLFHVWLSMLNR
jgi:hypothetical protein